MRDALAKGFMTACSGDGENQIKITFETLAEMQAAHGALVRYLNDVSAQRSERKPDVIGVLRSVHSALDSALGDTDVSHIENDDELRESHPVQWAAQWLAHAIELLQDGVHAERAPVEPGEIMSIIDAAMAWMPSENGPSYGTKRADLISRLDAILARRSPAVKKTLSDGWRRHDEIARIIDKHVRSEPDKNFIDRRWLVGVTEAATEIATLGGNSQPATSQADNIDKHPERYTDLARNIERIILRRLLQNKVDGYALEMSLEIASLCRSQPGNTEIERLRATITGYENTIVSQTAELANLRIAKTQLHGHIEYARNCFLAIQKATIEGKVCDDVAWFSQIETLHDYCGSAADRLSSPSTDSEASK